MKNPEIEENSSTKNDIVKFLNNNKLAYEKLNNKFCKHTLGVKRYTSNYGCKSELGIYPFSITILIWIIEYYCRVLHMDDNSLAYKSLM